MTSSTKYLQCPNVETSENNLLNVLDHTAGRVLFQTSLI